MSRVCFRTAIVFGVLAAACLLLAQFASPDISDLPIPPGALPTPPPVISDRGWLSLSVLFGLPAAVTAVLAWIANPPRVA